MKIVITAMFTHILRVHYKKKKKEADEVCAIE